MQGDSVFIVDYSLSHTAKIGSLVAARILPLPEFNIFSGVLAPVDERIVEASKNKLALLKSCHPDGSITPQERSELALYVFRQALAQDYVSLVAHY